MVINCPAVQRLVRTVAGGENEKKKGEFETDTPVTFGLTGLWDVRVGTGKRGRELENDSGGVPSRAHSLTNKKCGDGAPKQTISL